VERHGGRGSRAAAGAFGRRVGAIDSDTYEEAPGDLNAWLAKRSRWLKGWIQTLIVHSRHPGHMVRRMGPVRALAAMVVLSSTVLTSLFGPILLAVALWRTFWPGWGAPTVVDFWSSLITLLLLLSGSQAILTGAFVALRNRQLDRLHRLLPMFLLYQGLIAVAAWIAVVDLIRRPFYWAKTDHGRARTSIRLPSRAALQ
jgi:glycosyltransferase XagB